MENVLSSYLNTNLPLPCRKLNTTGNSVGKTGLPADRGSQRGRRKPVLAKAATIGDNPSNESSREHSMEDGGKRRCSSLSDSERLLTRGASSNLPTESNNNHVEKNSGPVDECDGCHRNNVTLSNNRHDDVVTTQLWKRSPFLAKAKYHFFRILSAAWYYINTAVGIVRQCSLPIMHDNLETLTNTQKTDNPLSDVLLSLGTEASQDHCKELWVTDCSTQLAVLTLLGGALDRFLKQELRIVVEKEENWVRALYRLRHTLWVEGARQLDHTPREKLTEFEREERKKGAVNAFKKFLPSKCDCEGQVLSGDPHVVCHVTIMCSIMWSCDHVVCHVSIM